MNAKLNGKPDVCLTLRNPQFIEDFTLHQSIRYNRFLRDRTLSFIPPDYPCRLLEYLVLMPENIYLPLSVQASVELGQPEEGVCITHM